MSTPKELPPGGKDSSMQWTFEAPLYGSSYMEYMETLKRIETLKVRFHWTFEDALGLRAAPSRPHADAALRTSSRICVGSEIDRLKTHAEELRKECLSQGYNVSVYPNNHYGPINFNERSDQHLLKAVNFPGSPWSPTPTRLYASEASQQDNIPSPDMEVHAETALKGCGVTGKIPAKAEQIDDPAMLNQQRNDFRRNCLPARIALISSVFTPVNMVGFDAITKVPISNMPPTQAEVISGIGGRMDRVSWTGSSSPLPRHRHNITNPRTPQRALYRHILQLEAELEGMDLKMKHLEVELERRRSDHAQVKTRLEEAVGSCHGTTVINTDSLLGNFAGNGTKGFCDFLHEFFNRTSVNKELVGSSNFRHHPVAFAFDWKRFGLNAFLMGRSSCNIRHHPSCRMGVHVPEYDFLTRQSEVVTIGPVVSPLNKISRTTRYHPIGLDARTKKEAG